ncbi:MAG: ABC transporter ATP-binding protein [Candidatus Omnitrophota bacterium]
MIQSHPIVRMVSASKEYEGVAGGVPLSVLKNINLEVNRGETVGIVGPSGSGKSTLLNLLGALDHPTSGAILVEEEDISNLNEEQLACFRNRKIGFIFQDHHLLPQCTILENVLLPALAFHASAPEESIQRANELLERVGLAERLNHRPAQLSGGERQRVAYVRSLVNQPLLLLADEPTGALDRENAGKLMQLLIEINRENGLTSIIVTHALALVKDMDRTYELKNGELSQYGIST